jgi:hypothetical protein
MVATTFEFAPGQAIAAQPPLPTLPPPEAAREVAPVAPPTLIPVEFRITIEDLEKQSLRSLIQKIDPKAAPVLPIVVKGNEPNFALGGEKGEKVEAGPPEVPKPLPEVGRENVQDIPANRPQLIPRQPGTHPRLDRLAARPLVAGMVGRMLGTVDLTYRIELRSFKLSFSGNTMTCELGGGFHAESKAVGPQGPATPPPDVRDISIKMTVTKNLEWNQNGKLELKEGTSKVWIDPEAPLVGFPRLDIERVVRLNGVLLLLGGTLDRELMKRMSGENLPDLAVIVPTLKQKMPFLAVSELTVYPVRGDEKNVYFSFEVGLVAANKPPEAVKITAKSGPAPEPKLRGRICFDRDGKPDVKLDPVR